MVVHIPYTRAARYTRETRWMPPPGAPRVELEWWERSYSERKAAERKSRAKAGDADFDFGPGRVADGVEEGDGVLL